MIRLFCRHRERHLVRGHGLSYQCAACGKVFPLLAPDTSKAEAIRQAMARGHQADAEARQRQQDAEAYARWKATVETASIVPIRRCK